MVVALAEVEIGWQRLGVFEMESRSSFMSVRR
jgi:hypothetical protein